MGSGSGKQLCWVQPVPKRTFSLMPPSSMTNGSVEVRVNKTFFSELLAVVGEGEANSSARFTRQQQGCSVCLTPLWPIVCCSSWPHPMKLNGCQTQLQTHCPPEQPSSSGRTAANTQQLENLKREPFNTGHYHKVIKWNGPSKFC